MNSEHGLAQWRAALEESKRMTIGERMARGGDLFDAACQAEFQTIRRANPGISDDDARALLQRSPRLTRRSEERQSRIATGKRIRWAKYPTISKKGPLLWLDNEY